MMFFFTHSSSIFFLFSLISCMNRLEIFFSWKENIICNKGSAFCRATYRERQSQIKRSNNNWVQRLSLFVSTKRDRDKLSIREMEMITMTLNSSNERDNKLVSKKPPLPPKKVSNIKNYIQWKSDDDNAHQIAKLIAHNEKLTLEISDLRKLLQRERIGVRELR